MKRDPDSLTMGGFRNRAGGTGLWPVVSGVPPETVEGRAVLRVPRIVSNARLPTKSGATPDLTGVTPVPPIWQRVILTSEC
jgi:hypothetical protein